MIRDNEKCIIHIVHRIDQMGWLLPLFRRQSIWTLAIWAAEYGSCVDCVFIATWITICLYLHFDNNNGCVYVIRYRITLSGHLAEVWHMVFVYVSSDICITLRQSLPPPHVYSLVLAHEKSEIKSTTTTTTTLNCHSTQRKHLTMFNCGNSV